MLLGLFTVLWMLSPEQGLISGAWLGLLRRGFGWGRFVLPLVMLAGGLALLLHHFEERVPVPEPEQLVGGVLLYAAALAGLQALTGAHSFAAGLETARLGAGGGVVGTAIWSLLVSALGQAGAVVVLIGWLLLAVAFSSSFSVPELLLVAVRGLEWLREQVKAFWPGPSIRRRSRASAAPMEGDVPAGSPTAARLADAASAAVVSSTTPLGPTAVRTVWERPDLESILEPGSAHKADDAYDQERARLIEDTLRAFGAPAHVVEINRGPTITQFGVEPDYIESRGGRRIKVKVSKIASLADDLALALAASSIRIEAPVPGKSYVGVEVPNAEISMVALRDVMESESFVRIDSRLRLGLGQDVSGRPMATDLASLPHLLVAGTTGAGKSVCINAIISCLLLQNTPDELRFVMVDPKRVELTYYNGIPHLLTPVVVDLDRVVPTLQWVSRQMDDRYRRFATEGARNIADYNQRMRQTNRAPLPYLVVVIDELADLMMMSPDETERVVTRLAQLARATGIHLVIATQRPSVDVVTGLIKANFPARIAFAVASSVDSRVIIDQPGAERLLGRGDMLFQAPDAAAPLRMQGVFVSEPELGRLIRYWKNAALGGEHTRPSAAAPRTTIPTGADLKQAPLWTDVREEIDEVAQDRDDLFDEAVAVVREQRRASISMLQRRLRIGYTRAARIIDQMESSGIVGPEPGGSQARDVLDYGELEPAEEES